MDNVYKLTAQNAIKNNNKLKTNARPRIRLEIEETEKEEKITKKIKNWSHEMCACCNICNLFMYEGPLFDAKAQHLNYIVRPTGAAHNFK